MIKKLAKSIREYKKETILTPIFMVFKDNGTPVKVLVVESPGEGMSKKHTSIRKIRK